WAGTTRHAVSTAHRALSEGPSHLPESRPWSSCISSRHYPATCWADLSRRPQVTCVLVPRATTLCARGGGILTQCRRGCTEKGGPYQTCRLAGAVRSLRPHAPY